MSIRSAKSDELEVTLSDSDDSSVLSDRSMAERKRSVYSDSFSDNSGRSYPESRPNSAKYSASVISKTTAGTTTNRHSTINRSNMTSAVRSVGKKKSALGAKVAANNSKKIDPITARILSAHHKRRAQANNHAGEIRRENESLQNELKSLRIQCKRQEKALSNFEDTQSALPQVLQRFEDDKRVLKDRLRKAKDTERRLEREKKRVELENDKQNRKLRELNAIIKKKNLDERFELQQKLTDAEERAQNAEQSLRDAQKNIVLQTQSLDRQLKKETRRRAKSEKQVQSALTEVRTLKEKMTERDRQLSVLNIYAQRNKKSSRNQSFHGESAARDEHNMSLLSIQYSGETRKRSDLAISPKIIPPIEPLSISSDPSPVVPTSKPEPIHPAFLTEVVPEVPEKSTEKLYSPIPADVPVSPPVLQKISKQPEKTADDLLDEMLGLSEPPVPKAPSPESPSILDLGANHISSSPRDESSPTLFDFESKSSKKDAILAQLRDLHANSEPETMLGNEIKNDVPNAKSVSKEKKSIFNIFDESPTEPIIEPKEIRIPRKEKSIESVKDLNEEEKKSIFEIFDQTPAEPIIEQNEAKIPRNEKPVEASNVLSEEQKRSIFAIFDDTPPEPIIEPKELIFPFADTSVESITIINDDDVGDLLTLKPGSKGKSRNKLDYNFSEPIKNLHQGKASNGTDYRAPKKENLIDNLFGNTGRLTYMSTSSHAIGAHGSAGPVGGAKRIKSTQGQKPVFLF